MTELSRSDVIEDGTDPQMLVLSAEECYRLLATQQIGRLGVNAEHYPLIFPVNYALDREVIVMRMSDGTKLAAASHANVTFEVDEIDQRTRSGWSVLVRGLAEEVTSAHRADLIARTEATDVAPWAPGEHGHWICRRAADVVRAAHGKSRRCSRRQRGGTPGGCPGAVAATAVPPDRPAPTAPAARTRPR
jgi:nitroimidazol reductase NimA-like FMN-containing flavoprotein (pyridoxamine 5'-phosphate oxidase superfamily)